MKNLFKRTLAILFFVISIGVIHLFVPLLSRLSSISDKDNTKYILYWMPMWDDETFSFGSMGYEVFKYCEFKNCFATRDRWAVPLEQFAAIVFHAPEFNPLQSEPWKRTSGQRYIFASMESPINADLIESSKYFYNFYNWTMTYRLDSDIPLAYGYVVQGTTNYTMPSLDTIQKKKGLAAWLVSHCNTSNYRSILVQKLQNLVPIDIYGSCGNLTCPSETWNQRRSSNACYDFIGKNYKFYLSFENSHCKDYVTEKLYAILERNIVPIVYGLADYNIIAPPKSVIVADKFASIQELADYLLYLDKNHEEYLKYFEWKKSYHIVRNGNRSVCTLCEMLNDPLEPPKTYDEINRWWMGENFNYCVRSYKELPRIFLQAVFPQLYVNESVSTY